MKEKKALWINGIGQLLLVAGVYLILLLKNIVGIITLGAGVALLILYYTIKRKMPASDEMIEAISGKSSKFAFIIILLTIVCLSAYNAFLSVIRTETILLILFTALIISKIVYQLFWYMSIRRKNENKK